MKTNGRTKQHARPKKLVAILLAIPLTLSLTTAAFASTSGQTNPLGIGNTTKRNAVWPPREASATDAGRNRPLTRMREAVQNRVESSDIEELRMAKQDLMESGDMERFQEALETLKELREQSKALWETVDGLNQQIRTQAKASRDSLHQSLLTLPIGDRVGALLAFRESLTPKQESVETVREKIRINQSLKTTSWLAFKQALLAGDSEAAETELEEIRSLKTDIIALQGELVAAKQALVAALSLPVPVAVQ